MPALILKVVFKMAKWVSTLILFLSFVWVALNPLAVTPNVVLGVMLWGSCVSVQWLVYFEKHGLPFF